MLRVTTNDFILSKDHSKKVLFISPTNNSLLNFLPVATALRSEDVDVAVACSAPPNDMLTLNRLFTGVKIFFEKDLSRLRDAYGVDITVAPEWNYEGPIRSTRVAFFHSLPDDELAINYNKTFLRSRYLGADIDYLLVALKQNSQTWSTNNYKHLVDGIWPASELIHRQPTIGIVPAGYPKIDYLRQKYASIPPEKKITFAPTSSAVTYGSVDEAEKILVSLLDNFPSHQINFRPYPTKDHQKIALGFIKNIKKHPRLFIDLGETGIESLYTSELVVTDQSSSAVTYAFSTGRGVVAYRPRSLKQQAELFSIGKIAKTTAELVEHIHWEVANPELRRKVIDESGHELFYNFDSSAQKIAAYIHDILYEKKSPHILSIPRRACGKLSLADKQRNIGSLISNSHYNKTVRGQVKKSVERLATAYGLSVSFTD